MRIVSFKIINGFSILLSLMLLLPAGRIMAQNQIGFGLFADPVVSWFSTDTKATQNSGARAGFNFGLTYNKYFANNYAFSTGISILSASGRLSDTATIIYFNSFTKSMPANQRVVYKIQYINVPIGLKFKSNQIGYITIFSDIGIDPKVLIGGKVDIDQPVNLNGESAMKELNRFNLGYHIMAGIEYSLGGSTAVVLGLGFENNFLDVTKDNPGQTIDKVTQKILKFRIGINF